MSLSHEQQLIQALHGEVNRLGQGLENAIKVLNNHTATLQTWSEQFTNSFARVAKDMNEVLDRLDKLEQENKEQEHDEGNDGSSDDGDDGTLDGS